MPYQLRTVEDFQNYFSGVEYRADHHAKEVNSVLLSLAGAVLLFKDPGTTLESRTYRGSPANVLFAKFRGKRIAFKYDHISRTVQIRKGTTRGTLLAKFNNKSSSNEILEIFRKLISTT